MKKLCSTKGLSREDWLELRKGGLGGSDIAAVAGVSRWRNAISVWLDKTGQASEQEESEAMYWGNVLEDVIAKEFATRNEGATVKRVNAILQHDLFPWALANLDRAVSLPGREDWGVLECKTTSAFNAEGWAEDQIPDEYMCQVQWYLGITGMKWGVVACLVGGQKYLQRFVERDDQLIHDLLKIGSDFWELVEKREMPALDGSVHASEALKKLHPRDNGQALDLSTIAPMSQVAVRHAFKDLVNAKAQIGEAEILKAQSENILKGVMGDHATAFFDDELQLSWKYVPTERLDVDALKAGDPGVYRKYLRESSYRRFSAKKPKPKKEKK